MKRRVLSLLLVITVMACMSFSTAFAATSYETVTAELSPDITIIVDGSECTFFNVDGDELQPILYDGTTYLPLRSIGELMGMNVNWDESTYTITISGTRTDDPVVGTEDTDAEFSYISVEVRYDFTIIVEGTTQTFKNVNGERVYPILYNGSTYLPIRAIGELMGKTVTWDEDTETIYLDGSSSSSSGSLVTDADSFNSTSGTTGSGTGEIRPERGNEDRPQDNGEIRPEESAPQSNVMTTKITLEMAKTIALQHAGIGINSIVFTKAKTDKEDGMLVYEIEFRSGTTEYEYEINASDGSIISCEVDNKKVEVDNRKEQVNQNGTTGSSYRQNDRPQGEIDQSNQTTTEELITETEAKGIAFSDADLSESGVTNSKVKLDRDDGIMVYDVEFYVGTTKYEYEINATTGEIISKEIDND